MGFNSAFKGLNFRDKKQCQERLLVFPVLNDVRKSGALLEGSQASAARPSYRSSRKKRVNVGHCWNGYVRGKDSPPVPH
jgi:hypothetical protein